MQKQKSIKKPRACFSFDSFSFSFVFLLEQKESPMRLQFMTFNIRHDHGEHASDKPFAQPPALPESLKGEQPWSLRKWKVADTVLMYSPDIVGFQVRTKEIL